MRILGIDPGIERVGWGIIETDAGKTIYRGCGCITTLKTHSPQERIAQIAGELRKIIRRESPDRAIIEKLFFAKNKKTALMVSESRGALLLVLAEEGVPTDEFTPLEVKAAITGNGRAEKHQVAWMVKNILKIKEEISSDDALDALALCLMLRK